jgi:hypothetical protein
MSFAADPILITEPGLAFGQYLITFTSQNGQVRADIFRRGRLIEAHVSFPTGLDGTNVADRYETELWDYAREKGWADNFKLIFS